LFSISSASLYLARLTNKTRILFGREYLCSNRIQLVS
jgi:hypothetical protein